MTLHLDLNPEQQKKVEILAKKHITKRVAKKKELMAVKAEGKTMSADERFNVASQGLDSQIAIKNEMKDILNAEQYDKWENVLNKRSRGKRQHKRDGENNKG